MRTRDKVKMNMVAKSDVGINEVVSRKEVGAPDNPVVISEGETQPVVNQSNTDHMLDRLVQMVDRVAGKFGGLEQRLAQLESDSVANSQVQKNFLTTPADAEEPRFAEPLGQGTKPKMRKTRVGPSDDEVIESDNESRTKKKKRAEKKTGHAIKVVPQEYLNKLAKCTDRTVVEKRPKPAETMTLAEAGLLSAQEIEELGNIALGAQAQATQFWAVEQQAPPVSQRADDDIHKDLLDYLKTDKQEQKDAGIKQVQWSNPPYRPLCKSLPGVNNMGRQRIIGSRIRGFKR